MKTKTKQPKPLTVSQSYFALEQALQRMAMETAGPAWDPNSPMQADLEGDVDDEITELMNAFDHCYENVRQLAETAKKQHIAYSQARKRRPRLEQAIHARVAAAAAKKPVIVHARNPRKIRRDGATR